MSSDAPRMAASQAVASAALGPVFAGFEFQLLIAGIAINQCFNYVLSEQYKADSRRLKGLLLFVMLAFTAATGLALAGIYHYGIWQDRDEDTLYSQTLDDCFATLPSGILGATVQAYLLRRASALFRSRIRRVIFLVIGSLIILTSLFGAIWYLVVSFLERAGKLEGLPGIFKFSVAIGIWTWASAVIDLTNTVTLVVLLKSKILGFSARTDGVIKRWIELSLATGLPTTIMAVLGASLSFAFPDGSSAANSPLAFWEIMPSLYACTFISTLAARERIRLGNESSVGHSRPQLSTQSLGTHNIALNPHPQGGNMLAPVLSHHQAQLCRVDSYSEEGNSKEGSKV